MLKLDETAEGRRLRIITSRDHALSMLDCELDEPAPHYEWATLWTRLAAADGFAADDIELAELLVQCADLRLTTGDIARAISEITEAHSIFRRHADHGHAHAAAALGDITHAARLVRTRYVVNPGLVMLIAPAQGSC